jgi:hypothetical protein
MHHGAQTTRANQVALGVSGSNYTLSGLTTGGNFQSGDTYLVTTDQSGNLYYSALPDVVTDCANATAAGADTLSCGNGAAANGANAAAWGVGANANGVVLQPLLAIDGGDVIDAVTAVVAVLAPTSATAAR